MCHLFAESPLEMESAVRRTVGANMQQQLLNIPRWRGFNNPWMAEDDQDVDFSYINLVDNPERYTGYKVTQRPSRSPPALLYALMLPAHPAHCEVLRRCSHQSTSLLFNCSAYTLLATVALASIEAEGKHVFLFAIVCTDCCQCARCRASMHTECGVQSMTRAASATLTTLKRVRSSESSIVSYQVTTLWVICSSKHMILLSFFQLAAISCSSNVQMTQDNIVTEGQFNIILHLCYGPLKTLTYMNE